MCVRVGSECYCVSSAWMIDLDRPCGAGAVLEAGTAVGSGSTVKAFVCSHEFSLRVFWNVHYFFFKFE